MGYELWASPITGYRRHGTRLRDFNASLGEKILVSTIAEPLKSCAARAPATEAASLLRGLDFDIAGVKEREDLPVKGYVRQADMTNGLVEDHLCEIDQMAVIDSTMTLPCLLDRMLDFKFVFVRENDAITGILTLADLNKPLIRTYFFGLISLLEIHMGYWARATYPNEEWHGLLSPRRLQAAADRQAERARRNQHLDLFQCLDFGDKSTLVTRSRLLINELNFESRGRAERFLSEAEKLRNGLAHSQYDLVMAGEWNDLISLIQHIEATIAVSDEAVEKRAAQYASMDMGALW